MNTLIKILGPRLNNGDVLANIIVEPEIGWNSKGFRVVKSNHPYYEVVGTNILEGEEYTKINSIIDEFAHFDSYDYKKGPKKVIIESVEKQKVDSNI